MPTIVYVVQPGDTLWKISRRFQVPVDEIVAQNGIRNSDMIHPGQQIQIYKKNNHSYYVVRPGDTLGDIAVHFQTTVQNLVDMNDIQDPNRIYAGQIIRVR